MLVVTGPPQSGASFGCINFLLYMYGSFVLFVVHVGFFCAFCCTCKVLLCFLLRLDIKLSYWVFLVVPHVEFDDICCKLVN